MLEKAKYRLEVKASFDGYIESVDTEGYGKASLLLGAGRNTKEDAIDFSAGIMLNKKTGDYVKKGDVIATFYTSEQSKFQDAQKVFENATHFSNSEPIARPLVLDRIE